MAANDQLISRKYWNQALGKVVEGPAEVFRSERMTPLDMRFANADGCNLVIEMLVLAAGRLNSLVCSPSNSSQTKLRSDRAPVPDV